VPGNNTITYRVGQIEKQVDSMDSKLYELVTNDIPHLQSDIASLKTRMNLLTIVNVGAVIVGLLFAKFL